MWALVDAADRGEGLGDFWLAVARASNWRRARWVRPLTHAVTLGDAIRAMCTSYVRQIPMNQLGLTVDGTVAWFRRCRIADVRGWPGNEPAEQYTLSFMLEVIRAAAGPDWLPEHLKLECSSSGWAAATSRLPGVRIEYDQPLLAVALPLALIRRPPIEWLLPAHAVGAGRASQQEACKENECGYCMGPSCGGSMSSPSALTPGFEFVLGLLQEYPCRIEAEENTGGAEHAHHDPLAS